MSVFGSRPVRVVVWACMLTACAYGCSFSSLRLQTKQFDNQLILREFAPDFPPIQRGQWLGLYEDQPISRQSIRTLEALFVSLSSSPQHYLPSTTLDLAMLCIRPGAESKVQQGALLRIVSEKHPVAGPCLGQILEVQENELLLDIGSRNEVQTGHRYYVQAPFSNEDLFILPETFSRSQTTCKIVHVYGNHRSVCRLEKPLSAQAHRSLLGKYVLLQMNTLQ